MVSMASIAVQSPEGTIFPRFPHAFPRLDSQVTLRARMAPCHVRTAATLFHRGHPAPGAPVDLVTSKSLVGW